MPKKIIFEKKNVLVTGGAGFIGSHLCDELIKTANVICLDNFSTGDEKNIDHLLAEPDFEFIRHDITEPIDLAALPELKKFKVDFQGIQEIYHTACPTSPKEYLSNRITTLLANSYGVRNALELAVKYQAKFMQFSSSVVYGPRRAEGVKIQENDLGLVDTTSERSAYDEGKRFAESMVANYRAAYGLDTKIVRLFRIYGPRLRLGDGHMLPDFVDNALDGRDLVIHGTEDFSTSLCYVSDCIDGVVKLMESDLAGPINLGSDIEMKLMDLAEKVITKVGSGSKVVFADKMLFMTPLCLPDIAMARNELGWMPVIPLDKGLEKTIYEIRASKGLKTVK